MPGACRKVSRGRGAWMKHSFHYIGTLGTESKQVGVPLARKFNVNYRKGSIDARSTSRGAFPKHGELKSEHGTHTHTHSHTHTVFTN